MADPAQEPVSADISPRLSLATDGDEHYNVTDNKWPSGTFVLEVCLFTNLVTVIILTLIQ